MFPFLFLFFLCRAKKLVMDPITTTDVMAALACTKPSARTLQGKYQSWQSEFESVLSWWWWMRNVQIIEVCLKTFLIISFLNFIKNAFRCRIICVMLIIVNYQKEKNVTARFSVCFHFITANIPGSWNLANEWDKKKESKWRINEWHTFKSKHGFSPLIRAPLQTPATLWGHRCWWCDSAVAAVAAVEASDLDRRTNFRRQFRDFAWRETGENQVREIAISSHLI